MPIVLALLAACATTPTLAPERAPPLDLACQTDGDCVVDCMIHGACCGELCPPCSQVYNRASFDAARRWHDAACGETEDRPAVACPVASCVQPKTRYEARCVDRVCQAVAVPLEGVP